LTRAQTRRAGADADLSPLFNGVAPPPKNGQRDE
jgi:hypothetical protein